MRNVLFEIMGCGFDILLPVIVVIGLVGNLLTGSIFRMGGGYGKKK